MSPFGRARFWLPVLLAASAVVFFSGFAQASPPKQPDPNAPGEPLSFVQVVAGGAHACGLTDSGGVYCWGSNGNGQLGEGYGFDSSFAVPVAGLSSGVVQLAAGGSATCALLEDGSVQCWPQEWAELAPYTPAGLESDVTALAGGRWHFCALVAEEVLCWGNNGDGQLGDGTTDEQVDPTPLQGLAGAPAAIDAGDNHTCAVLQDGAVQCWGSNSYGQLGDGGVESSVSPVDVVGLEAAAEAVAAGSDHTCALLEGGDVQCWGYNAGIVADRSVWSLAEPASAAVLSGASQIAAGGNTTCGLIDGSVRCIASFNGYGQLGAQGETDATSSPEPIRLADTATSLSVGQDFACASLENGEAQCWGSNQWGQSGAGLPVIRDIPVTVGNVLSPTMVGIGGLSSRGFTCAQTAEEFLCWGDNAARQIVDSDNLMQTGLPTPSINLPAAVMQMSAGVQRVCTLLQNGSVWCWGPNFYGDLGSGRDESSFEPVQVVGLRGITTLVGGNGHLCALSDAGQVSCWGENGEGQLGTGDGAPSNRPVTPGGLESGVVALYGSDAGTCAQMEDGQVLCWGPNYSGALGAGDREHQMTPVRLTLLDETPLALSLGGSHACALLEGGAVECWGGNYRGQLGITGANALTTTTGTVEELPGPAISIHAGGQNTCAILEDNSLWCWGWNASGQLGAGSAVLSSAQPLPVMGLGVGVRDVVMGAQHACAILEEGELRCWGSDGDGQLGIGTSAGSATPQTVVDRPVPQLALDASRGAPGSRFTLSGYNLPADTPLTITANGEVLSPTLQTLGRGSLLAWLDAAEADAGYYELLVATSDEVTDAVPFSSTLHLLVAEDAALLEPGGGGLPVLALPEGLARDVEDAPAELQRQTLLVLRAGVNLRDAPNGEIVGQTAAETEVIYDAARVPAAAAETVLPTEEGGEVTLTGASAVDRVWLPVLWEEQEAWVADVVVEQVIER